jgi:membrane carboxypeptidase/penicillin-binding protein PbpC
LWRRYRATVLAVKISQEQTKDQILENYLNVIYFGRGAYGIETAAQTVSEAALLAGAIQAPETSDPTTYFETSVVRWASVLDGMVTQGWISLVDRNLQSFPSVLREPPPTPGIPGDSGAHVYKGPRLRATRLPTVWEIRSGPFGGSGA